MCESLPWWFVVPVAFAVGIFLLAEDHGRRFKRYVYPFLEWIGVER